MKFGSQINTPMLVISSSLALLALAIVPRLCRIVLLGGFLAFLKSEKAKHTSVPMLTFPMLVSMGTFCFAEAMSIVFGNHFWSILVCGWIAACVPLGYVRMVGNTELLILAVIVLMFQVLGLTSMSFAFVPLAYDFQKRSTNNAAFAMVMLCLAWNILELLPQSLLFREAFQSVTFYMALSAQSRVAWYI